MDERPEWLKRENRDWEKVYSEYGLAQIPWHSDKPDQEFMELIEDRDVKPCRVLDVGCGAGTDAIYLASKGSDVTAIDVSHEAIRIAKEKAGQMGVKVNFIAGNFLDVEFDDSFDFVNDRGCFHHMDPSDRESFAARIDGVLKSNGLYYLRCWSDKEEREGGAYKISKDIMDSIFSKYFDVEEMKDFRFGGKGARGYICLMKKKA